MKGSMNGECAFLWMHHSISVDTGKILIELPLFRRVEVEEIGLGWADEREGGVEGEVFEELRLKVTIVVEEREVKELVCREADWRKLWREGGRNKETGIGHGIGRGCGCTESGEIRRR